MHRTDPRVRLVCGLAVTVPAALLTDSQAAWLALAFSLLLVKMARLNLVRVLNRLAVVNVFIAFLWLFLPFSLPGYPLWSIGPLNLTQEGVDLALLITVKSNAIVLSLMALLGTIPVQDLGPALQQLKMPDKLCHILLFTYRYIFVIHKEYVTMRQAMRARGFRPRTNRHTYRSYAWLVGMLLVRSWDRAERVGEAMRCRGFRGRFYSLARFDARTGDYAFLALCLLFSAFVVYLGFIRKGAL
ncbi:MAG: cobalt ECF transporter T component CbiQ [Desulfovibrionaceae bacterium]|nr:cobalt ECF transporter T component CbiQ [Desulfovibrionaceae bacterium]